MESPTYYTIWLKNIGLNSVGYALIILPLALITIFARKSRHRFALKIKRCRLIEILSFGYEERLRNNNDVLELNFYLDDESIERRFKTQASIERPVENSLSVKSIATFISLFIVELTTLLFYGVVQEKVMVTKYIDKHDSTKSFYFNDSQFVMFSDRLFSFVFAIILLLGFKYAQNPRPLFRAPYIKLLYSSLFILLANWCQQEALKYIDFPSKVISKSLKIVPVMIIGHFYMKNRYKMIDYLTVMAITLGTIGFMVAFATNNIQHAHKLVQEYSLGDGMTLLALFTTIDAVSNSYQGLIFKKYEASCWEVMAAQNLMIIALTATTLVSVKGHTSTWTKVTTSDDLVRDLAWMSVMEALGQAASYMTISRYGALVAIMFVTIRQVLAIFISSFVYGHNLSPWSLVGVAIIFLAIFCHAIYKLRYENSSKKPNFKTVISVSQIVDVD